MEYLSKNLQTTQEIAQELASKVKSGDVIELYGSLGAGKTTFVGFFVKALGSSARVQSPTFVILRKYTGGRLNVNHLDLYRLSGKDEILDLGLPELISEPDTVTLIEWPELAENFLPEKTTKIYFEYVDENTRRIDVQDLY